MAKDKKKGAGQWDSRGGSGSRPHGLEHVEGCSGLHSESGYCVVAEDDHDREAAERARLVGSKRFKDLNKWAQDLFNDHASAVISAASGRALHPDDDADLGTAFADELGTVPSRFRAAAKETAGQIRKLVSEGNRRDAWALAREAGTKLAAELAGSTWTPPEPDHSDLDAIIEAVPR